MGFASNSRLCNTLSQPLIPASGMAVQRGDFPIRIRTMALISDATVIIEAGDTSGSLSQGWEALRLGRPLFIAKSAIDYGSLTWPKQMLNHGQARDAGRAAHNKRSTNGKKCGVKDGRFPASGSHIFYPISFTNCH